MRRKKSALALALLFGAALLLPPALDVRLRTATYRVETGRAGGTARLALLTDLHSCAYGSGQRELLGALARAKPDLVLFGGDLFDDRIPPAAAMTVARAAAARWPCFYVTGNHEVWSGRAEALCADLAALGVTVLRGTSAEREIGALRLRLCGIDDPAAGRMDAQLAALTARPDDGRFTVLLAHRPEHTAAYRAGGFDLVLAGHAHGGQWRIPFLLNGLLAPGQGLFPRYAGGLYDLGGGTRMVVSRGLARESTRVPRLFNRPELVIVTLHGTDAA